MGGPRECVLPFAWQKAGKRAGMVTVPMGTGKGLGKDVGKDSLGLADPASDPELDPLLYRGLAAQEKEMVKKRSAPSSHQTKREGNVEEDMQCAQAEEEAAVARKTE